jgi:uncharacterized protein (TIGR01777 family)
MRTAEKLRIAITGASGLVGRALRAMLAADGHEVWPLERVGQTAHPSEFTWNTATGAITTPAPPDALVHLAGRSIGTRWTKRVRREMWDSRVPATRHLCGFLAALPPEKRPRTLIAASAVGVYGSRGDELLTEATPPSTSDGFLTDLARNWEAATDPATSAGIRVVTLRFGHVLSGEGGVLGKLAGPVKWGVAGPIGSGMQWMPWIARRDLCRLIERAVTDDSIRGVLNAVGPAPVRQIEFIRTLGKILHRPTIFPLPAFLVKLIFGQMGTEALLGSQRVIATRLPPDFTYDYPMLEAAMRAALANER